ncbi:MAG: phosphoribosylanthranilate isomerase [Synergistetes bacterium]|nr:phosphoribosylanthranilate isomerase [Synergistota bacterium]MCX8128002.1 phosphoribosylanthranilate isomerase [Synergistota bacterium]MDW8192803.1 phosphoribosylanthranilate isomerase [Synergistota bacterium]
MLKVKICGIKREEDLKKAIELGFDAIGFILCQSNRQITLEKALNLSSLVPPFVSLVAVVKDPTPNEIENIIKARIFTYIQFHGEESPETLEKVPIKRIKTIAIRNENDLMITKLYLKVADLFLFDTKLGEKTGGTGRSFDWLILKKYDRSKPFILAGGIGIHNVKKAVESVFPNAIDVNSSLEIEPGIKDHQKMEKLMKIIKEIKGG